MVLWHLNIENICKQTRVPTAGHAGEFPHRALCQDLSCWMCWVIGVRGAHLTDGASSFGKSLGLKTPEPVGRAVEWHSSSLCLCYLWIAQTTVSFDKGSCDLRDRWCARYEMCLCGGTWRKPFSIWGEPDDCSSVIRGAFYHWLSIAE